MINSGTAENVTSGPCLSRFCHIVTGYQGTCKTIREVVGRASAYEWAGIIAGGLHT